MAYRNISMFRGDTLSFGMEIEGLDQSLDSAYFTCKKNPEDTTPVFQKSLTSGISEVSTGVYRIRVAPEDTEEVPVGKYFYDFEIGVNDDVFTILNGILDIKQDVTN